MRLAIPKVVQRPLRADDASTSPALAAAATVHPLLLPLLDTAAKSMPDLGKGQAVTSRSPASSGAQKVALSRTVSEIFFSPADDTLIPSVESTPRLPDDAGSSSEGISRAHRSTLLLPDSGARNDFVRVRCGGKAVENKLLAELEKAIHSQGSLELSLKSKSCDTAWRSPRMTRGLVKQASQLLVGYPALDPHRPPRR